MAVHAGTFAQSAPLTTTDYGVDDVIVNGESTKAPYWSGVIDKDYTFEILCHEFGTYTVDFDVDDPSRVVRYTTATARMVPRSLLLLQVSTLSSSRRATMVVLYILLLPRVQYSKKRAYRQRRKTSLTVRAEL